MKYIDLMNSLSKDKESLINSLTKKSCEIVVDFENKLDIDEIHDKVYKLLVELDGILGEEDYEKYLSKAIKIVSVSVYNLYCYRTKELEMINVNRLEQLYRNDEEKEVIDYVGFIDALDKTTEIELMEVLETTVMTNKKINENLWMSIYDVMATEYNISIGAESSGDDWVKGWNNYGKNKA